MRALPVLTVAVILGLTPFVSGFAVLEPSFELADRVPRGPIFINGDQGFCSMPGSGVVNCGRADGSAEAPYVISGWSIRAAADAGLPAITIQHTTKHVIVEMNRFVTPCSDMVPTMRLADAEHVTVRGNVMVSGLSSAIDGDALTDFGLVNNEVLAACANLTGVPLVDLDGVTGADVTGNSFGGVEENEKLHADGLFVLANGADLAFADNRYHDANGTAVTMTDVGDVTSTGETFDAVRTGVAITNAASAAYTGVDMDGVVNGLVVTDTPSFALASSSISDDWPCSPSCLPIDLGSGLMLTNSYMAPDVSHEDVSITGFETGLLVDTPTPGGWEHNCRDSSPEDWVAFSVTSWSITGNTIGVHSLPGSCVKLSDSNIVGNTAWGAYQEGAGKIRAKNVWWGDPQGPGAGDANDVFGRVVYPPVAQSPHDI